MNTSDLAYIKPTIHKVLSAYLNGWMSHSNSRKALCAIGLPADEAEALLRAAWTGKA